MQHCRIPSWSAQRVCYIFYIYERRHRGSFYTRKLARLRAQLLEPTTGAGSGGGSGFDVSKSGGTIYTSDL